MKIEAAEFIRSAVSPRDFLRDGRPEVAFVGRSNVGKSSLLNRLLGRKGLARTGSTPGRTRTVNYFLINGGFYCVDLPGYGYAKAAKDARQEWAELIDQYLREARPCRVILLIDAMVGATPLDSEAFQYLMGLDLPVTLVATKIDRLSRGRWRTALEKIQRELPSGGQPIVPFSAQTGDGVKELWREIVPHLAGARERNV